MIIKSFLLTGIALLSGLYVWSQYKVSFVIEKLPPYHNKSAPIFLAGSFNRWNPKDSLFMIPGGKNGITIELKGGMYEFKLTQGSWEKGEADDQGEGAPNRKLNVQNDTTVALSVEQWSDHFPKKPVQSTASKNVHILDTAFFIPQLGRYRRIWIYLPSSYSTSRKRYPVLYLQDGQNVFDAATSFSGEWGVDETLDALGKKHGEIIVIAIDNGGEKRLNEYAPFDMKEYGKGEGKVYTDFLISTLQPYINKHYRTLKSAKNNFIAGSSMGGLISLYAALEHPHKFGGAGVFSPALWINPQIKELQPNGLKKLKSRLYFFAGAKESASMVPDMLEVVEKLKAHSKSSIETVIYPEGTHSEREWRNAFPAFYKWMLEGKD